jgi:Na+-translocating ferredoxin:NAD+ oxidoreductase subunit B
MKSEEMMYRELQIHLNKETLGFPETSSGSEIRVLKQLFTPEQAEITMLLTYKLQSLPQNSIPTKTQRSST